MTLKNWNPNNLTQKNWSPNNWTPKNWSWTIWTPKNWSPKNCHFEYGVFESKPVDGRQGTLASSIGVSVEDPPNETRPGKGLSSKLKIC